MREEKNKTCASYMDWQWTAEDQASWRYRCQLEDCYPPVFMNLELKHMHMQGQEMIPNKVTVVHAFLC